MRGLSRSCLYMLSLRGESFVHLPNHVSRSQPRSSVEQGPSAATSPGVTGSGPKGEKRAEAVCAVHRTLCVGAPPPGLGAFTTLSEGDGLSVSLGPLPYRCVVLSIFVSLCLCGTTEMAVVTL